MIRSGVWVKSKIKSKSKIKTRMDAHTNRLKCYDRVPSFYSEEQSWPVKQPLSPAPD